MQEKKVHAFLFTESVIVYEIAQNALMSKTVKMAIQGGYIKCKDTKQRIIMTNGAKTNVRTP